MKTTLVYAAFAAALAVAAFAFGVARSDGRPNVVDAEKSVEASVAAPAVDAANGLDQALRETRESNRKLREAVAELTAAVRSLHREAASTSVAVPTSEAAWSTRLAAREPDVVLEEVCRLREETLTRALSHDRSAEEELKGRLAGGTPEEVEIFRKASELNAANQRKLAELCRAALHELDGVRTIDDLARWRVTHVER